MKGTPVAHRKRTLWDLIGQALCCYCFIYPGSEWRHYSHWYETSAMADLLGSGFELTKCTNVCVSIILHRV
ncbi:MAG TPA: hypothetical protein PK344_14155 [Syntrophorhabdaceae bacterium]|nr:hypothetical protein [Syntrophorhabdaceae bacterium]